jgi:preprotein translocase subunit SecG
MQSLLIVVQLVVSLALVAVVLLQKSEGGALGMGGGGSGLGGLFSPRGAADTLTRTTAILAIVFFVSSLGLTLFALHGRPEPTSILDQQTSPAKVQPLTLPKHAPAPARPAVPQGPAVPNPHPQ